MSTSNNESWGNPQIAIVALILIVFFIWAFAGGRHFFRGTGHDLQRTVQDAGDDLRSSGRDAASTIRHDVQ